MDGHVYANSHSIQYGYSNPDLNGDFNKNLYSDFHNVAYFNTNINNDLAPDGSGYGNRFSDQ